MQKSMNISPMLVTYANVIETTGTRSARLRWVPLARLEAKRVLSSVGPWLLAAFLPLWLYRPSYGGVELLGTNITLGYLQYLAQILLPAAIVLLGYQTIAAERESGRLKIPLSLPLTRRQLLLGVFCGRLGAVLVPVGMAVLIVTAAGMIKHGLVAPLQFVAMLGAVFLYVAALSSIVVGVSALVSRGITAVSFLFLGLFLILELLWRGVVYSVVTTVTETGLLADGTGLEYFLLRLAPSNAYTTLTNWILGTGNATQPFDSLARGPGGTVVDSFDTVPLYLHEASGLVILLLWIVLPLGVGLLAFDRGDAV